jgi:hypothetical protein
MARICERDNAAALGANSLDEASKMSQRSLDACRVSVADLVQRLNEPVGIVAQRHHGIRLVDKLNDCAARVNAGAPDRCAGELSEDARSQVPGATAQGARARHATNPVEAVNGDIGVHHLRFVHYRTQPRAL